MTRCQCVLCSFVRDNTGVTIPSRRSVGALPLTCRGGLQRRSFPHLTARKQASLTTPTASTRQTSLCTSLSPSYFGDRPIAPNHTRQTEPTPRVPATLPRVLPQSLLSRAASMVLVKTVCSVVGEPHPDIRRFTLEGRGDFPALRAKIVETYAYLEAADLREAAFRWTDQDGDNITIANSEDWLEAVRYADEDWFQCVRVIVELCPANEVAAVAMPLSTPVLTQSMEAAATPASPLLSAGDQVNTTTESGSMDADHTPMAQAAKVIKGLLERRAVFQATEQRAPTKSPDVRASMSKASAVLEAFFGRRNSKKIVRFADEQVACARVAEAVASARQHQSSRSDLLADIRKAGASKVAQQHPGRLADKPAMTEVMQALAQQLETLQAAANTSATALSAKRQQRMEQCRFQCNRHMSWHAGLGAAKRGLEIQKILRNIALRY